MNEQVSLWQVITSLGVPVLGLLFAWLRGQIKDQVEDAKALAVRLAAAEAEVNALRAQLAAAALDAEKRYINWKYMDDFKVDIFKRFDRLEKTLSRIQPGGLHQDA